ncbi:cation diffusion facilitator family transporter [Methanobrevibacter gottschalkii]|uniref:Cation diffusion facilitator family transporter n=2 Tax=Methanobrevibacter gottschalkii TaxID=190974 RepID=A0A3N5BPA3_9EURY|nr:MULTISPECIES: cation diffusion facilitator family transporter [Methanobrevibacter]MCQ2970701.1 cation diffusion facilitator family transporter [archaeon]OEC97087.1 cation transporter [Methanobrevibacter sp. A27]RPF51598.1 cation diffusion facilitator family transporter [Methanobrevibacter gottschalkii DSM 11977]SEL24731.1 cation diffusion facilitator family transporter [Methanobrevibacter gottschalkii]
MDELRNKGGKKAVTVAIIANTFLTVFNIIVGMLSGSYALISEGGHTLSDITTTIIAYIGFKIGQKPADKEHPLGHGRAEAISGLIIMLFLTMVAYEIMSGAIEKLFNPSTITTPDIYAAVMAIFGIFINYIISEYIIRLGKQINSPAIVADGKHQKTDIFSSIAILIGVLVSNIGYPILDPIIGLIIGFLILKTAYGIGKENLDNIMGKIPSEKFVNEIRKIANESSDYANNAHNIKVDYLGSYAAVTLHIEIDGNMTLNESHKIVHIVQNNIIERIPDVKYVNVHACPKGLDYNHNQEIDK